MPKFLPVFALVAFVAAASGCSGGASAGRGVSGWFGGGKTSAASEKVLYAGRAGIDVLSKPSAGSKPVGRLALHEKVIQSKEENGFAKIRARGGSLEGWVPSARLLRRLPGSKASASGAGSRPGDPPTEAGADPVSPDAASDAESAAAGADVSETSPTTEDPALPDADGATADRAGDAPAPAAPAPMGPDRPRGVGASVFDPY